MAEAEIAPLKKNGEKEQAALDIEFDTGKKYMFELAERNLEREKPVINMRTQRPEAHKPFKPFQNIVFTSQIVWNGSRTNIRYYDGCESIFISKQPKEKDVIDQLIKQTRPRNFLEGKLGVFGDERMLLMYLFMCSWNTDSPFRTRAANGIFTSVNADKIANEKKNRLDNIQKALKLATECTDEKMLIHANYLGISLFDYDSQNELTNEQIRSEYKEEALRDAVGFIKSFGDKSIEIKYYIEKALEDGTISTTYNHNKATWGSAHTEICDISGLKSPEAIGEKLLEFSQLEGGSQFVAQLKALYKI